MASLYHKKRKKERGFANKSVRKFYFRENRLLGGYRPT